MSSELHREIYESMNLRETEDLLGIWQTNNRVEWSDEAFQVVSEILRSRGVEPPEQGEPILEHVDAEEDTSDLTEEELRIADDENPPDFYDPFAVFQLGRWLRVAAVAAIVIALLANINAFPPFRATVQSYFAAMPGGNAIASVLTVLLLILTVAFQAVVTCLPLLALAHILRILMQMEFNSRKAREAE